MNDASSLIGQVQDLQVEGASKIVSMKEYFAPPFIVLYNCISLT